MDHDNRMHQNQLMISVELVIQDFTRMQENEKGRDHNRRFCINVECKERPTVPFRNI
jgi:hypothetical protein